MCPKLLLLFSKRSLFLALNSTTTKNHHNRLVSSLLPICRTARRGLILLPFMRAKFLSPFPPFLNGRHAFSIISLGFLTRSKNIILRNECILLLFGYPCFLRGLQFSEFAFRFATTRALYSFGCFLDTQLVQQGKIGRCQNLAEKQSALRAKSMGYLYLCGGQHRMSRRLRGLYLGG